MCFSGQSPSQGGNPWDLHQLPRHRHPVRREQAVLLRPGWAGQQVLSSAWYISTQWQGE